MYLEKAYRNPTQQNLLSLRKYLVELRGNELKNELIQNYITKASWKVNDAKMILRANLQAATEFLDFIMHPIRIQNSIPQIKALIADLSELLRDVVSDEELDWISISTNVIPSTIHFKQAKRLFLERQVSQDEHDLLALCGLRLALEKRVFSILKIDYALSKNRPIKLSEVIEIVKNLKSIEFSKEIDWDKIAKANRWLNHYIHRQIRPYPWSTFKVIEILSPLLDTGSYKYGHKRISSFYHSTVVVNETNLEEEITSVLEEKYIEIEIKHSVSREALIISKNEE